MKRRILKWIIIIVLGLFVIPFIALWGTYYWKRVGPINQEELRDEIIESIQIPFSNIDTLLTESEWEICGNTSVFERPAVFDIQIDSASNINKLKKRVDKEIIKSSDYSNSLNNFCYASILAEKNNVLKIIGCIKKK